MSCGWFGSDQNQKPCICAPAVITKYQKQISEPLLDRIDIHIEVQRLDYEKLSKDRVGEPSDHILPAYKLHGIFIRNALPITAHRILSAMPVCASDRSGNTVDRQGKSRV